MNRGELQALYERYALLVHRRCVRLLGTPADADDALQDVFLRAHSTSPPRAAGAYLVWLYRIATHCCYDKLRVTKRRQGRAHLLDPDEPLQLVDADHRALMGMVLRDVDPDVCEVGLLHHVDGLTQEELAATLDLSRKTIGKRLQQFELEFRSRWPLAKGATP